MAVADINGDGLPDVVTNSTILINHSRRRVPATRPGRAKAAALATADRPSRLTSPAPVTPPAPAGLDPASVTRYFAALWSQDPGAAWSLPRSETRTRPAAIGLRDETGLAWTADQDRLADLLAG